MRNEHQIVKLSILSANTIKINQACDNHENLKFRILGVSVYALREGVIY